jgi:hypothetical protein
VRLPVASDRTVPRVVFDVSARKLRRIKQITCCAGGLYALNIFRLRSREESEKVLLAELKSLLLSINSTRSSI